LNAITLSICIATVNRGHLIGETLDCILSQATDEVEVVIVDGGSTDNTPEMVGCFKRNDGRLRYFRQDTNLGVDRDFNRAVELARGEYCWLMSDDDILKPGAVQRVLEEIRHGFGLIVVNAEVRNVDFSKLLVERRLPFLEDRVYPPGDPGRLFLEVADFLSFIGCVVIRRDLWVAREKEPYFGSLFIHVGIIFQAPLPFHALAIAEPLVTIRFGNQMWTPRSFEIWMFKWPGLLWSFEHIPEEIKVRCLPRDPWRRPEVLLLYRAKGAYTIAEYRKWIAPRSRSRLEKLSAWIIARSPGLFLNLLGILCFSTYYRRYRLHLEDLRASRFYYRKRLGRLFPISSAGSK